MILALCMLGLLGAASVLASEMPRTLAWPLAAMAMAYAAWLARCESRRQRREFTWPIGGGPMLDGVQLEEARLRWRGALAFLQWRDGRGRMRRLAWWPDTLEAGARRELRLAAMSADNGPAVASMAP